MKRILLFLAPVFILLLAYRPVESQRVEGTVTGEDGKSLSGVTIQVKGRASKIQTGSDGRYALILADSRGTLIFSARGYLQQEVPIKGRRVIHVKMDAFPPCEMVDVTATHNEEFYCGLPRPDYMEDTCDVECKELPASPQSKGRGECCFPARPADHPKNKKRLLQN